MFWALPIILLPGECHRLSLMIGSPSGMSWSGNKLLPEPMLTRARFLSFTRSKLRLWSANHRAGYFSNLACDWLSKVWAYSEQETENWPRISGITRLKAYSSWSTTYMVHSKMDPCFSTFTLSDAFGSAVFVVMGLQYVMNVAIA